MQSPCLKAAERVCLYGCCPGPVLGDAQDHHPVKSNPKSKNTSATCRQGFATTTTSSLFPNNWFTDTESLPSFQESLIQFTKAYPQFSDTTRIDQIRAQEYYHLSLSNHICLDYIGIGLFSYWQAQPHYSSALSLASSSSPPPPQNSDSPYFSAAYKSVNLKSQLLHGGEGSDLESAIKKRILDFLNISQNDYSMVFTANKSSAFRLLAESYPFQSSRKLLTAYDYENEALQTMVNTSKRRGAKVMSAEFKWPRLRIHGAKLRKMIIRKKKKKKHRGLFVFPLQSRMTGASYSYQWMSMAQENGWHVLLDACALGPKDMDSFGLSLFRPDFLVCSFYKIFGDNPTGFGCLFVKKSTVPILEASTSSGIVSLIPAKQVSRILEDSSGTDSELELATSFQTEEDKRNISSFSSVSVISQHIQSAKSAETETSATQSTDFSRKEKRVGNSEGESEKAIVLLNKINLEHHENEGAQIECRCLDHVDSLGLMLTSSRGRYLINWLVSALMKLQHPNRLDNFPLVRIYGPKIKFNRGPALSLNIYDWKAEKVDPLLVQKLADRNNISLSTGFLHNIWFSEKYEQEKEKILERRKSEENETEKSKSRKADRGITVVTIAISFLANFEDIYRFWAFVARFLDADFVEKERWRYTALNQKTVEL